MFVRCLRGWYRALFHDQPNRWKGLLCGLGYRIRHALRLCCFNESLWRQSGAGRMEVSTFVTIETIQGGVAKQNHPRPLCHATVSPRSGAALPRLSPRLQIRLTLFEIGILLLLGNQPLDDVIVRLFDSGVPWVVTEIGMVDLQIAELAAHIFKILVGIKILQGHHVGNVDQMSLFVIAQKRPDGQRGWIDVQHAEPW